MTAPPTLEDALGTLSEAHGPSALAAAFGRLKGLVRRSRRDPGAGVLAQTLMEALRQRDIQRAAGATPSELGANLERTVRASWPTSRAWRYLCEECRDTGLILEVCQRGQRCDGVSTRTDMAGQTAGKYSRLCASDPDSAYKHDYGRPCLCRLGSRFQAAPKTDQDFAAATKTTARKPARWGR